MTRDVRPGARPTDTDYGRAVSAWAAHLRAGGTTPWSSWRASGASFDAEVLDPLPDAVHLELARRLNALGGPAPGLVDVVLGASAPDRGMVDVPLPWPGEGAPRFGPPPLEPAEVPAAELVRMAVGVLARLLPGVPPEEAPRRSPRWPLPGRRRFAVHGSPGTAAALRAAAVSSGAVESNWRPIHLVVALPVGVMMAEIWAERTRAGDILRWEAFWRRTMAAGRLPTALDPVGTATRLAAEGQDVHVLVAPASEKAVHLGLRALGLATDARSPGDPSGRSATDDPAAIDLLRRLNRVLALTEGVDRVVPLGQVLLQRVLPAPGTPTTRPTPPGPGRGWAQRQGRTAAERLTSVGRHAGYAVHGDPDALARVVRESGAIDDDRTLGLALTACLRAWQLQGGRPGMGHR